MLWPVLLSVSGFRLGPRFAHIASIIMAPAWMRRLAKLGKNERKPRRLAVSYRPVIEPMEDRVVPTTLSLPASIIAAKASIVTVPINVDSLDDAVNGTSGLSAATLVLAYDANVLTVSNSDIQLGSVFNGSPGWSVSANAATPGQLVIVLSTSSNVLTATAGGSLALVNFHVKSTPVIGTTTLIDLAADNGGSPPDTGLADQNFNPYILANPPQDGLDANDGILTVTGINHPPVANNDAWSVTECALAGDPGLTVACPGVLANDTDIDGDLLTAVDFSARRHGTLVINANGSFIYTPDLGYVGSDGFSYMAFDGLADSNVATVTLTVAPRLSIPTWLSGTQGSAVVVPVLIDNPNPAGLVASSQPLWPSTTTRRCSLSPTPTCNSARWSTAGAWLPTSMRPQVR